MTNLVRALVRLTCGCPVRVFPEKVNWGRAGTDIHLNCVVSLLWVKAD